MANRIKYSIQFGLGLFRPVTAEDTVKTVYFGELSDDETYWSIDEVLEEIFKVLNLEHPEDYKERSLSVGDGITLILDDKFKGFYRVEACGFKRLC